MKTDSADAPLNKRQRALISALAAFPYPRLVDAARRLQIPEQTAKNWKLQPHFKQALRDAYAREEAEVRRDLQQRLQGLGDKAIATITGTLEAEKAETRLVAAKYVLDRVLGKPEEHSGQPGEVLIREYIGIPLDEV